MRSTLLLAVTTLVLCGCDEDATEPPDPVVALLADVRATTEPYRQIETAIEGGFAAVSECVVTPAGGMGFHYLNGPLLDGVVEATQPELLLYEPVAGGGMRLVGVEYMVMAPDWDATNTSPPQLLGNSFTDHRAEDARHGLPFPHYDLHFWAWEPNPSGTFEPFNPNVGCDEAG